MAQRSDRTRGALLAAVLEALIVLLVSSCKSPDLATPPPTVAPSVGAASPAARFTENDARDWFVSMLDPDGQPMVDLVMRIDYEQVARLDTRERERPSGPGNPPLEGLHWWRWLDRRGTAVPDQPMIVIVGSCLDIELASLAWQRQPDSGLPWLPASSASAAGPQRVWMVAIYDAVTGEEIADGSFPGRDVSVNARDFIDGLKTLAPAIPAATLTAPSISAPVATPVPRPGAPSAERRTSTPSPVATAPQPPAGSVPLQGSTLTADEQAALAVFPLRQGTRWIYRYVQRDDYRWSTSTVTVEVQSGWRAPNDVLLWHVWTSARWESHDQHQNDRSAEQPASGSGTVFQEGETTLAFHGGTFYEPGGQRDAYGRPVSDAELEPLQALGSWGPLLRLPIEITDPPTPWTIGPAESLYSGFQPVARQRVTVPAGTFDECSVLRLPIGAGASHWRWFCPGVGFVREESYGNNPTYWQAKLELISVRTGLP